MSMMKTEEPPRTLKDVLGDIEFYEEAVQKREEYKDLFNDDEFYEVKGVSKYSESNLHEIFTITMRGFAYLRNAIPRLKKERKMLAVYYSKKSFPYTRRSFLLNPDLVAIRFTISGDGYEELDTNITKTQVVLEKLKAEKYAMENPEEVVVVTEKVKVETDYTVTEELPPEDVETFELGSEFDI